MTKEDVYELLKHAEQLYYDDQWWDIYAFDQDECWLCGGDFDDEIKVPLTDIARADDTRYYALKQITLKDIRPEDDSQ